MKTAILLLTLTTTLISTTSRALAQDEVSVASFGGDFTIYYSEDDTRNYYAVNLGELKDEALQKAFIKKVYYDSQLAALSSPSSTGVWCLTAHKVFDKELILKRLNEYKAELLVSGEPVTDGGTK